MSNVSSDLSIGHDQRPTFLVDAQPVVQKPATEPRKSKAKSRVRGASRVGKRARTSSESSLKSSTLRSSRETSASTVTPASERENQELNADKFSTEASKSPMVSHNYYLPPLTGDISNPYGRPPAPPSQARQYSNYSSRIEDIGVSPPLGESQSQGQTVRSQYIMATNNAVWRGA